MEKKKVLKSWLPILITSGVILLVFSTLAFLVFRYQINPDGISYINIAERYAAFDFSGALNGYWGVLLSWILVPFLWIGADPVISLYVISILSSIGTVLLVHKFAIAKLSSLNTLPLYLIELTLLLILASLSLSVLTPDILLSFVLFLVFLAFVGFNDKPNVKRGILLGASGALLYFTKPVGLILFLFLLLAYVIYLVVLKKNGLKFIIPVVITLILLVLPFCIALSLKYNKPTFTTGSTYNIDFISPIKQRSHTITSPGIYLPANEHDTSVWDDPTYLPAAKWSPFHSTTDFKYYINQILINFQGLGMHMGNLGIIFMLGLTSLLGTIFLAKKHRIEALFGSFLVLGLMGIYSLSVVEPRYLWPLIPLSFAGLLLMANYLVSKSASYQGITLFLASAIIIFNLPLVLPVNAGSINPDYLQVSDSLKKHVTPGSRLASDDAGTMYSCFRTNIQCVGILPTTADQKTIDFLRQNDVKYLYLNDPEPYQSVIDKYYSRIDSNVNLYILR